jgi:hypothetical protein
MKNLSIMFIAIFAMVFTLLSCSKKNHFNTSIKGRLLDEETKSPFVNEIVTLKLKPSYGMLSVFEIANAVTKSNGEYELLFNYNLKIVHCNMDYFLFNCGLNYKYNVSN